MKGSVNSEMSRDMNCGGPWPRQLGNSGDSHRAVGSALGLQKNIGSEAEPAVPRFPGLCLQKLLLSSPFFFTLLSPVAFSSLPHHWSPFTLAHAACLDCQMKCNLIA